MHSSLSVNCVFLCGLAGAWWGYKYILLCSPSVGVGLCSSPGLSSAQLHTELRPHEISASNCSHFKIIWYTVEHSLVSYSLSQNGTYPWLMALDALKNDNNNLDQTCTWSSHFNAINWVPQARRLRYGRWGDLSNAIQKARPDQRWTLGIPALSLCGIPSALSHEQTIMQN